MKKICGIFILFTLIISCSENICEKYSKNYIPTDLNDSLEYLNCIWSDQEKDNFKKMEEEEAVTSLHFGYGMSIRNSRGLWKRGNKLTEYFNELGIFHPDDISSIILRSFHRKLNNLDIGLDQQTGFYKEYWKKEQETDGENEIESGDEPEF